MPPRPRLPLALTGALLVAVVPGASAAELGEPFATRGGTCTPGDGTLVVLAPAPVDEQAVVRGAVSGGPAVISEQQLADGDVAWSIASGPFGGQHRVALDCAGADGPVDYTLAFHAIPALPTSFSGRGRVDSSLPFTIDRPAAVGAELDVAGGVVELFGPEPAARGPHGPGPASAALGTFPGGRGTLGLGPVGAGTEWTLRLRALPATLGAFRVDPALPAGSAGITGSFTLDRPARVQVTVNDARGAGIDFPLTPTDLAAGTYPLGWDGRTLAGALAADGRYEVRVRSQDAAGTTSELVGPVLVDRRGPQLALRRGSVQLRQPVVVTATDEPAGIGSLSVRVGGARTVVAGPGERTVSVPPPPDGWPAGRTALEIVATDNAGNRTTRTLGFRAYEVNGLPCGRDAAVDRVLNTRRVTDALARTRAARGRTVASTYAVSRVLCADLDGDRIREMAVLLRARRSAGAPTPLVVFRASGERMYAPRVLTTKYALRGLAVRGRVLRATVGGGRRLTVRAAGGRFVLRVKRP